VEKQFEAEERHMIPSLKVATYDKDPNMSVQGVADKVADVLRAGEHEFVMCNFAPPDMVRLSALCAFRTLWELMRVSVGHTGEYSAAVEAIGKTDAAVGMVYTACEEAGYILLVTADHGNAEQMLNPDTGAPLTAHTTNAVPLIMTGDPEKFKLVLDKDKGEEEEVRRGRCLMSCLLFWIFWVWISLKVSLVFGAFVVAW
jgi:2,3-bisphosphoglycerate-independent phosphoglycerate mutase